MGEERWHVVQNHDIDVGPVKGRAEIGHQLQSIGQRAPRVERPGEEEGDVEVAVRPHPTCGSRTEKVCGPDLAPLGDTPRDGTLDRRHVSHRYRYFTQFRSGERGTRREVFAARERDGALDSRRRLGGPKDLEGSGSATTPIPADISSRFAVHPNS